MEYFSTTQTALAVVSFSADLYVRKCTYMLMGTLSCLNNNRHHVSQNNHVLEHTQCHVPFHNSLQFLIWGQTHTGPQGTSPLGGYYLEQPSEGMSNHSHPPQASCLRRGAIATGTRHTQWIHHRQHGGGQRVNPVYMVNTMREWWTIGCGHHYWVCDSLVLSETHLLHDSPTTLL